MDSVIASFTWIIWYSSLEYKPLFTQGTTTTLWSMFQLVPWCPPDLAEAKDIAMAALGTDGGELLIDLLYVPTALWYSEGWAWAMASCLFRWMDN